VDPISEHSAALGAEELRPAGRIAPFVLRPPIRRILPAHFGVSTRFRDPLTFFVGVETGDGSLHEPRLRCTTPHSSPGW